MWEKAYVRHSGDTSVVFVPIDLKSTIVVTKGGKTGSNLNNKIFLRIVDSGRGFENSPIEMVSMIPNQDQSSKDSFSGIMIVEDWFHPAARFIDLRSGSTKNTNRKMSSTKGGMTTQGYYECVQINITACAGVIGYMHCETTSSTTCSGGGGSTGGSGSSGEGSNPGNGGGGSNGSVTVPLPEWLPVSKIYNQVTEPCLARVIDATLNSGVKDEIMNIIDKFVGRDHLNITYKNAPILEKGADAKTKAQRTLGTNGALDRVDVTITFSDTNFVNVSKEYITTTLIHEAVHAYLRTNPNTFYDLEETDHETLSIRYVEPLSDFLISMYGISAFDAYSLTWRGLMSTKAYKNANSFNVQGTIYSKELIEQTGVQYLISQKGQPKCD
ncbi:hypothetical protein OQY15_09660 [Pedobacter sp. MC2016-15]|uniref:hypothetical protein n=1 Tax=Pedobacter sp. MC2016-15 TaxID=2994473 RepID=UPI00224745AF|nr:hypothetical protein [Pedobacter sp. MC2016-15]MCX2479355.1 hypothetical protein [Pedobacter sp. MC2016-15]